MKMNLLRLGIVMAAMCLVSCATFAKNTLTHQMTSASTSLESMRGRVVVINYWADWCAPCIKELPALATVVSEAGPDVSFFAAYYEPEPHSRQFHGWYEKQPEWFRKRVYWSTPDLRSEYLSGSIPVTIVLGRDGQLVEKFTGSINNRVPQFRAALQRALVPSPQVVSDHAGLPPATP